MRRREFIAGLGSAMGWPIAARAQQSAIPHITLDTGLSEQSAIQVGAEMRSGITALAAHNNAMWCDAVCRAHDRPGEFHGTLWLTRLGTPRFYPDVVTTAGAEAAPAQIEAIADLIGSNRRREWFVKDSFHCLHLESLGFEPLFDAEWIAINGARPDVRHHQPGARSTIVTDEAGLSAWERSWVGEEANAAAAPLPRVFMPRLLADDSIAFVSIQEEDGSAGGGILNRGADVVGLSNLFGSAMDRVWRSLIPMAGEIFPGLPLVGYEHGRDLAAAKLAGFEAIGSLRIWRLPAKAG
ncbi:hypothetical protein JQ594_05550 [Bradyrhizobium manausense]|uniref:hypothetical protein n=1 Tax=Bradyrhizobium manausense TaxID=989370 RepID=UPI001BA56982|nr:hypothetical protein [Bradyrhizobium manausense]MBR0685370.1 hypothetical protein [Bradyrhizobium manausense]